MRKRYYDPGEAPLPKRRFIPVGSVEEVDAVTGKPTGKQRVVSVPRGVYRGMEPRPELPVERGSLERLGAAELKRRRRAEKRRRDAGG